ncbi:MAG: arsenic efflux protein [Kiritimatiellae bacterium]|nr:arsenic efflux protein [Kiritimatiellia bacterium]
MIEILVDILVDNLLLLPFLFPTYLVLEAIEAHAGGALERTLGRARRWGPFVGAVSGAVPQCGFSAAAASLYAGGVITCGTLVAVFLSTSDELIPVLVSKAMPIGLLVKIVGFKVAFGLAAGLAVDAVLRARGRLMPSPHVGDLCAHSRCGCAEHRGIVIPALIHTAEIFLFILVVSGMLELALHFAGDDVLKSFVLNKPVIGELLAGLAGMVPNCAVSVAFAQLYAEGGMSAGALMSGSLAGSGLGLLVLFRTHCRLKDNLVILAAVYVFGVVFGHLAGYFF